MSTNLFLQANQAIDSGSPLAVSLAERYGANLENVGHTQWFVYALANELLRHKPIDVISEQFAN